MRIRAGLLSCLFLGFPAISLAEPKPTPEAIEFFEKKIRPLFAEHCYSCHGEKKQEASLRLDRQKDLVKGGDMGPVIKPGDPAKSSLIAAIQYQGDVQMPPKKKMAPAEIELIVQWVKMGAPYPEDTASVANAGDPSKTHWAFQPLRMVNPPADKGDLTHPIDRFVQEKLDAAKLKMSPPADKRALLRRITYDLTGLLPTQSEIDAFLADKSPNAYEKVLDRLLASPHYGEHQARHWMDLARYSDTKGYVFEEDRNYPYAYTYRDWLIRSFNADMPYSEFVINQLAADRHSKDNPANLAAMGFLTVGRRFLNNQADIIDDRLDVTFRTFQGLTVTCARCHDHKFDPIPIKDYYSLYGVFASSVEPKDLPLIEAQKDTPELRAFQEELKKREDTERDTLEKTKAEYKTKLRQPASLSSYLLTAADPRSADKAQAGALAGERKLIVIVLERWRNYLLTGAGKSNPVFVPFHALAKIPEKEFAAKWSETLSKLKPSEAHPEIVASLQAKRPATFKDVCDLYGEKLASPGKDEKLAAILGAGGPLDIDERQYMRIFNVREQQGIRALRRKVEEWKAKSPVAPPRAMVMVDGNPVQPVVFLRGNPNNRGPQIPRQYLGIIAGPERKPFTDGSGRLEMAKAIADPKNPLTSRVMVNRVWVHLFGQGIVRTPSDFGVRSDLPTHPEMLDWLARSFDQSKGSIKQLHKLIMMSKTYQQSSARTPEITKLDPENRLLSHMNRKRMTFEGLRDNLLQASGKLDGTVGGKSVDLFKEPVTTRRAVYGFIDRQNLPGTFRSFDVALPDTHAPQRFVTTVPQQALFLMNSPFVLEQAKSLSVRIVGKNDAERIQSLYQLGLGRAATAEELAIAGEFLSDSNNVAQFESSPVWHYGSAKYNGASKRVEQFAPLPFNNGSAWQGSKTLPDAKLGWCSLNSNGGHPGRDLAVVRRWVAPVDGTISIQGSLNHPAKVGDGVRGLVVSSQGKVLGQWEAKGNVVETTVASTPVKKGETIDFVTECKQDENSDSFQWAPQVKLLSQFGDKSYDAAKEFNKAPGSGGLVPMEQLAQVILLSNEFAFID
jgi:hypothetical protein